MLSARHVLVTGAILLAGCREVESPVLRNTTGLRPARNHTPAPSFVSIPGTFNTEMGCAGDWDPACAQAQLSRDANDDVWKGTYTLPSGAYEYKVAINKTWDENYGANAVQNGANIALSSDGTTPITFFYSHDTHWATSTAQGDIVTAPGSFQSELGCAADWDPACLRSWLQDPDADGIYTFTTTALPSGTYDAKVAINRSWTVNYGAGGEPNGANISFNVPSTGDSVRFSYDGSTHVLTVGVTMPVSIDVLPGDDANVINLKKRFITVAVLGSATFTVGDIDVSSVRFGPALAAVAYDPTNRKRLAHSDDVNADGLPDLLMQFATDQTGLTTADVSACLSGQKNAGVHFVGCNSVVVLSR